MIDNIFLGIIIVPCYRIELQHNHDHQHTTPRKISEFSTHELLLILEESEDYQPEAITAVNTVLAGRAITPEQQEHAREKAEEIRIEREHPVEWITSIHQLIGEVFQRLIDFLNPIQEEPISLRRRIIMVASLYSLFGLQFIWSWGPNFQFLQEYPAALTEIDFLIEMIPSVLVPIAVVFFWTRKKAGWLLLNGYTAYFVVSNLFTLGYFATREPVSSFGLNHLPMRPPILPILIQTILAGVLLWLMNRESFRAAFGVKKIQGLRVMGLGLILAVLVICYTVF